VLAEFSFFLVVFCLFLHIFVVICLHLFLMYGSIGQFLDPLLCLHTMHFEELLISPSGLRLEFFGIIV
jgi:hypothetical protein